MTAKDLLQSCGVKVLWKAESEWKPGSLLVGLQNANLEKFSSGQFYNLGLQLLRKAVLI